MRKRYAYGVIALLAEGYFAFSYLYPKDNLSKEPFVPEKFQLAGGPERENRGFPQREIVDLASEYPDTFFRQGSIKEAKVALSFDDGSDNNYTVKILDTLKKHKVPATFFVIGSRCELYPKVMKRMVKEGHRLGNHTWSHPNMVKMSNEAILKELTKTDEIIKKYAGYTPVIFRSPYGSLKREQVEFLRDKGYKLISWNVDSLDWKGLSAAEIKTNVLENLEQGSIILQHSAGGPGEDLSGTVKALDEIIRVLKKDGYKFVTVDEILEIEYKR